MEPWYKKLTSRKFISAISIAVWGVLNETYGWNVDPVVFASVAATVIGWIIGEAQLDKQRIHATQMTNMQALASQNQALARELQNVGTGVSYADEFGVNGDGPEGI